MGRGGCYEREGRRSWRLLGHACVATLLLVNAVANSIRLSNCTATDFVNNTPRGCELVLRHLLCQLPSISHHSFWSPRSCLRPSRSAAAPELPVLEVAGQHRICMSVAPTGSPGEREDAHTCALAHINSFSEQRVNRSANGLTVNSTRQTVCDISWLPEIFQTPEHWSRNLSPWTLLAYVPTLLAHTNCHKHPWSDTSVSGGLTPPQAATAGSGRP